MEHHSVRYLDKECKPWGSLLCCVLQGWKPWNIILRIVYLANGQVSGKGKEYGLESSADFAVRKEGIVRNFDLKELSPGFVDDLLFVVLSMSSLVYNSCMFE